MRTFSSIAASVRDRDLDDLLSGPEEAPRPAARMAKLRYRSGLNEQDGRSGFHQVGDGANVQMDEVARLTGDNIPSP